MQGEKQKKIVVFRNKAINIYENKKRNVNVPNFQLELNTEAMGLQYRWEKLTYLTQYRPIVRE